MNISLRYTAITGITVLAIAVFAVTLARATLFPPGEDASLSPPPSAAFEHPDPGDEPARLQIPSLGVNAAVQQTGLTKSGAMGVPTNFTDVAWYKYGPVPGQLGSAVIDGHVDNGLSLPGVFKHLGDIQKGADMYVVTKKGETLHFVVTDIESYPYKSVPTSMIFTRADKARLNLITCEGHWVQGEKTYDQRLVIFAELK
jgi:sortase A